MAVRTLNAEKILNGMHIAFEKGQEQGKTIGLIEASTLLTRLEQDLKVAGYDTKTLEVLAYAVMRLRQVHGFRQERIHAVNEFTEIYNEVEQELKPSKENG